MVKENSKILTMSFLIGGVIVAIVANALFTAFAATWTVVAQAHATGAIRHGIPVGFGIITFLILQFHPGAIAYSDEVVTELKKVVWPSRKDTTAMTIVVSIMLIISGFVLGFFDLVSNELVKLMLRSF